MTSIRLHTAANVRAFQTLTGLLGTTLSELKHQIDEEALEDEFGRFRVWSGNLGALQKGHSSLDYRLRDSPLLSSNALKLLEELESNINEIAAVLQGSRLPYDQQAQDAPVEDEHDDFFSEDEDDDDSEAGLPKTELRQRFGEIIDIIDNLYKLSVRIRTPTIKTRSLKAASYRPKDPETGVDLFDQYADLDLQHAKTLIRSFREPNIVGHSDEDEWLIDRLSKAITLRRRQFKYWRRHRDKLGLSTALEEAEEDKFATPGRPELSPRHATLDAQPGTPAVLIPEVRGTPSQRTGKTLLSGTEATQHHQSLDELVDNKSVTSYATTVHDLTGRGVELPSPPKAADGDKDFECPYCFIICPARYGKGRPWRTHLLQDLQPYLCTYPDCECGEQLFRSRREWSEHEATHRKAWRCPEHPHAVFTSTSSLESHLRQQHQDKIQEPQLETIVKVGETSTVDLRQTCPICFVDADTIVGGLQNHLANHLERIAAFALPKDIDTADDESGGGSSAASLGTSQDLSDVTLQNGSDTEEEQETVHAVSTFDEAIETEGIRPTLSLSAATLDTLPDASHDRLNILLPSQKRQIDDSDSLNFQELESAPARENDDSEELPASLSPLKQHLSSLEGASSTQFFQRRVYWRGFVHFESEGAAIAGLKAFDQSRFPEVRIRIGVRDEARLIFSVPVDQNLSKSTTKDEDSSSSSVPVSYEANLSETSRMPILPVSEIPTLRSLYRSRKLQQRDQSYVPNDAYNQMISFTFYDITRLRVGAIVNSANRAMKITRTNDSLNRFVHKTAGPGLKRECKSIGRVAVGQVRLTSGHELPCTYILHAARPQYISSFKGLEKFTKLKECYREALKIARENNIRTLAFPCLAAGGCGFPSRVAARTALEEVRKFLDVYKNNPFERIIFCVFNGNDEQAYKDFLPVFFPPTHGDLENIAPLEHHREPATLATQLTETYNQLGHIARELAEFTDSVPDFPQSVFNELAAIGFTLRKLAELFENSKDTAPKSSQNILDIDLICSVLQGAYAGLIEITEQTQSSSQFGQPSHKTIWDDYNFHMRNSQGLDIAALLELCQDFVQCLEDILLRGGIELHEMATMRIRLGSFRLKQTGESHKDVEDKFAEIMYTREFQRDAVVPSRTDAIKAYQIPSISRLYQLDELGSRPTNAIPNGRFNHIVCLYREDITRLEVDAIANSTDMAFAGMGTLDRTVFRKGGFAMQQECANFGVCREGDVRVTQGYNLPCKHVIHTIPPETYRSNTKDVLRKIYRELLFVATSLKATSLAIPTLGTGMLNYPKRDCASLAMEEVKRFLETTDPSNPLEKIIFCVFGSNDEFIYRSLLPTFFPPVNDNDNVNKALPSEWRQNSRALEATRTSSTAEASPPPRRTVFQSIGEAFLNVTMGKQPANATSRRLNAGEEHALINFESHAQGCETCSNIAKLYAEGRDLCAEGYGAAQSVLQYLYMEADRSVYPMNAEGGNRIKVEIPEEFPLSWNLLVTVEKSFRDTDQKRPFVSRSEPYATRAKEKEKRGQQPHVSFAPTVQQVPRDDPVEKANAFVFAWSQSRNDWEILLPYECSVFIFPGRLDVFEVDYGTDRQIPLLSLELTENAQVEKEMSTQINITAINLQEPRDGPVKRYMFRSQSPTACEMLFTRVKHARTAVPQPPPRRNPGTATAHVFYKLKSLPDADFQPLDSTECLIHIYLGRLEVHENEHAQSYSGPLLALELSPDVEIDTSACDIVLKARPLPESRVEATSNILFRSKDLEDCTTLHEFILWGSANNPTYLAKQNNRSQRHVEGKVEADGAPASALLSPASKLGSEVLPVATEASSSDDHLPIGSFIERLQAITATVTQYRYTSPPPPPPPPPPQTPAVYDIGDIPGIPPPVPEIPNSSMYPFCHFAFKPGILEIFEKTVPKLANPPIYRVALVPAMQVNRVSETQIEIIGPSATSPEGTPLSSESTRYVVRFQHLGDCSLLLHGLARFRTPAPHSAPKTETLERSTSIMASVQKWDAKLALWSPTIGVDCRITLSSGKMEIDAGSAEADPQSSSFRLELRLDPSTSFFQNSDTVVNFRAFSFSGSDIENSRHRLRILTKNTADCALLLKRLEQHSLWPEDEILPGSIQSTDTGSMSVLSQQAQEASGPVSPPAPPTIPEPPEEDAGTAAVQQWDSLKREYKPPILCRVLLGTGTVRLCKEKPASDEPSVLAVELTRPTNLRKASMTSVNIEARRTGIAESNTEYGKIEKILLFVSNELDRDKLYDRLEEHRLNVDELAEDPQASRALAHFNDAFTMRTKPIPVTAYYSSHGLPIPGFSLLPDECEVYLRPALGFLDFYELGANPEHASPILNRAIGTSGSISQVSETEILFQSPPDLGAYGLLIRTRNKDDCDILFGQIQAFRMRKKAYEETKLEPELIPVPDVPQRIYSMQGTDDIQTPHAAQYDQTQSTSARLDLAISGLGTINIEDYFSYLDLAATSSMFTDTAPKWRAQPTAQNAPSSSTAPAVPSRLKRSMSLPLDPAPSTPDTTLPKPPSNPESEDEQPEHQAREEAVDLDEEDEDDGIRHPRPTTPDHEQDQPIPPGARWTKIDRRLVNPQALEEANERFEERADCVIVLRVLRREEIIRLAERTREIRRGRDGE